MKRKMDKERRLEKNDILGPIIVKFNMNTGKIVDMRHFDLFATLVLERTFDPILYKATLICGSDEIEMELVDNTSGSHIYRFPECDGKLFRIYGEDENIRAFLYIVRDGEIIQI